MLGRRFLAFSADGVLDQKQSTFDSDASEEWKALEFLMTRPFSSSRRIRRCYYMRAEGKVPRENVAIMRLLSGILYGAGIEGK